MKDLLEDIIVWVITIAIVVGAVVSIVYGFLCLCSIQAHGSGEMDAYIVQTERIGDRVFVKAKDSAGSSNTYEGCVSTSDEQKFKDAVGKKVKLEWDGVFSLSPFWTECPAPVRIKESCEVDG